MTFWFFALGVPLFGYGLFTVVRPKEATRFLLAFPRNRIAGQVLCAAAWLWTAYEIDTIGIEVFDRIVRRLWFFQSDIPGMVWILAIILTVLTCLWMENLLTLRALSALFMLFPAELFPAVRLCDMGFLSMKRADSSGLQPQPVGCEFLLLFYFLSIRGQFVLCSCWNRGASHGHSTGL